jgi:two-component system, NarL family, nitrate/nitrite response regulator NarL
MNDQPDMSQHQRILVIDDHPLFRRGVQQLIAMEPDFELVGEAGGGAEGVRMARDLLPDLVLLDLNMAGMDGLQVLAEIKALDLPTRVVMLTVSNSDEDLVAALRAGADGYLLKDMEPESLLESLREAARGRMVLSDTLTEMLAHALRKDSRPTPVEQAGLTEREREILGLIAQGRSNKLIARELDITEGTVKVHVKHLLKKLNLRSRVEAAVWMVEQGKPD